MNDSLSRTVCSRSLRARSGGEPHANRLRMRSTAKKKNATANPSGTSTCQRMSAGAAAAHGRVPALEEPAVGRELLDDGVGAAGLRRAGEVAAEQGEDEVDAGADGAGLRRRLGERDDEQGEAAGHAGGDQREQDDGVEAAPLDAEDQAAGDEQHHRLHQHRDEHRDELAADDRRRAASAW